MSVILIGGKRVSTFGFSDLARSGNVAFHPGGGLRLCLYKYRILQISNNE